MTGPVTRQEQADVMETAGRRGRSVRSGWLLTRWPAIVALLIAVPVMWVATTSSLVWPGRLFPGFFVLVNGIVPSIGLQSWTGMEAGVPFHVRVLDVAGRPFRTQQDVYDYVATQPEGTPVSYRFEKDGETFTRTVPTMRFGWRDWLLTVGLFVVNGVLFVAAGVGVFLMQPMRVSARAFLVLCFFFALFPLTAPPIYDPAWSWLTPLQLLASSIFPASFIHLGLVFPVERHVIRRQPAWLLLPYAVGVVLGLVTIRGFYSTPPDLTPVYVGSLWCVLGIVALVGLVAFAYWENREPLVRPRLKAVLPGLVIANSVAFFGFLSMAGSAGGTFPINLIAVTPIIFLLAIGYAIARHDLFDIDHVVKQTLVYAALTVGITAAYTGCLVLLGWLAPTRVVTASPVFNVAFVVLVAIGFEPLRLRVQHVVDRTFFRTKVDYRRTVTEMSTALTSLLDLDEILGRLAFTLSEGFAPRSLAILLWLPDRTRVWRVESGTGRLTEGQGRRFDALRVVLARNPRQPWAAPTDQIDPPLHEVAAQREVAALDAALVVPLAHGETVTAAFVLGPRRSGLPYGRSDFELLDTLAAQSTIAIQNALLYGELAALNADLEAKVRGRTAELERSNGELAHAYRDLQSAQAQLLHTEKMASLGQLVAGVAHEINNPVSFIAGNIHPLRKTVAALRDIAARHGIAELGAIAERTGTILDLLAEGAERTSTIVKDLRSFSRVDEEAMRPVDVHEGIDVSLRLLAPRWNGRVEIHREYGDVPKVEASPGQLNQVFMNLLANACDAVGDAGNIWITTLAEDNAVRITIRDDGPGIAAEHLGRILDPFFTTKPQGKGTGLGLAITHGIVTKHGGTIHVESTPGAGTAFSIRLPASRDSSDLDGSRQRARVG
jgi:signal transduction histidine kinase